MFPNGNQIPSAASPHRERNLWFRSNRRRREVTVRSTCVEEMPRMMATIGFIHSPTAGPYSGLLSPDVVRQGRGDNNDEELARSLASLWPFFKSAETTSSAL